MRTSGRPGCGQPPGRDSERAYRSWLCSRRDGPAAPGPCGYRGCAVGSWGDGCLSMAPYVTLTGPNDGATVAGGRSCCLSAPHVRPSAFQCRKALFEAGAVHICTWSTASSVCCAQAMAQSHCHNRLAFVFRGGTCKRIEVRLLSRKAVGECPQKSRQLAQKLGRAPQSRFGYATIRSPRPGVVNFLTVLFTPSVLPLLSSELTL